MKNDGANVLWYRQGALSWNEALPLGNGRLGAMVYGGAADERICLNDDSLWSGKPGFCDRPGAQEALARAQALSMRPETPCEIAREWTEKQTDADGNLRVRAVVEWKTSVAVTRGALYRQGG